MRYSLWFKQDNGFDTGCVVTTAIQSLQDLYYLAKYANFVKSLDGDVAEMGVYRGGASKVIARLFEMTDKTIHLFDTFTGMPPSSDKDGDRGWNGWDKTSAEIVSSFLSDCPNIKIHAGLFSDTLPLVADKKFCLVYVDCDLYESAKECCEFFYPRMVTGGLMVFHDYYALHIKGIKLAVDEFFNNKPDLSLPVARTSAFLVVKK